MVICRTDVESTSLKTEFLKQKLGPGWVDQLVRALPLHAKIVGSIPGQGVHKKQPINV